MPYGPAPAYCFPLAEFCMYGLFLVCLYFAYKRGPNHLAYLLGGVAFGLILEYVNVSNNMQYVYGKFIVMFGRSPNDIPLCIGLGWGVIMYCARLYSDALKLPLWSAAAFDALLAINIDLSMDAVAYRLHMWNWDWTATNENPLTAGWFGVPFGNFYGWLLVVFLYSSLSRLLEKWTSNKKQNRLISTVIPVIAVILSQVALYTLLVYVSRFLSAQFGITSKHRFIFLLILFLLMVFTAWRKTSPKPSSLNLPVITWLIPLWFHLFFFVWLFAGGFYKETQWLVITAVVNLIIGVLIHLPLMKKSQPEMAAGKM
jgi:hypothetical protein